MQIGILGSGEVGQSLGLGFIKLGHDVKLGSRDPAKLKSWVARAGRHGSTGTPEETARFADIAVLATAWAGTESALQLANAATALAGKVVMDVTNPLTTEGGKLRLMLAHTDSGVEQVQRWLPQSKVVKAFNTVGHAQMVDPKFAGGPPDMFICGDDASAKQVVAGFCKSFGWGVVDAGGIDASRLLEPLCILWVEYGTRSKTWNHAFKLLRG